MYDINVFFEVNHDWFVPHDQVPVDPSPNINFDQGSHVIVAPEHVVDDWHIQGTDFTCAVVSQEMILKQFGVNVSEAQLVYEATSHGWLTSAGTMPTDMANLLELHGVHAHVCPNGSVESLAAELARGHGVIVSVDGGELWNQDYPLEDLFFRNGADHAIVVKGLDLTDPQHPKVVVNDPGDPSGAGRAYPLDHFLNAWADSGNYFVATDHAPAHLASHSLFGFHFNPASGAYMDLTFWLNWLASVLDVFNAVDFRSQFQDQFSETLNPSHEPNGWVFDHGIWEQLPDMERNEILRAI